MVEVIMSVITVRIDRETKKRMEQMKEVNWSEVVRRAIRERMNEGDAPNKALAVMLNERFRVSAPKGYDSTRVIRAWRDSVRWKRQ